MPWIKEGQRTYDIYVWKSNAKKIGYALLAFFLLYAWATGDSKPTSRTAPVHETR